MPDTVRPGSPESTPRSKGRGRWLRGLGSVLSWIGRLPGRWAWWLLGVSSKLFELRRPPGRWSRLLLGLASVCLVCGLWTLVTWGAEAEERILSPVLLPSPFEVFGSAKGLFQERDLVRGIFVTLQRVLMGFGLAILVGVPLGILAASFRMFDAFMAPLATFGRNIPIAALIPLSLLWFGIDEAQKVMFIFIACVPFIFFDALQAVMGVHDRYVETAQTLGARNHQIIWKVLVPLALPDIFNSLRLLFGLAFGYIMLAELVNAKNGLGFLLLTSQRLALTEDMFFILIVICILAFAIDRFLYWFQRGVFPFRKESGT